MKVKLLKKIRKRYSIIYYPNGVYLDNDFYDGPITVLYDTQNDYRTKISSAHKEQAYGLLYGMLLKWIKKDYSKYRKRKKNIIEEILWYK
jgi:hypothetical protein